MTSPSPDFVRFFRAPRSVRSVWSVRAILLALIASLAAVQAMAAPLDDYHRRVDEAIELVAQFQSTDEYTAPIPLSSQLEPLRTLLPTTESVDVDGRTIVVDNSWVPRALDRYAVLESLDDRIEAIYGIAVKLDEIDRHILDLEGAPRHATAQDRQQLDEILRRSEFQERGENPVSKFIRETRDQLLKWLSDLLQPLFGGAAGEGLGFGLRILIILGAALALLLLGRAVWQAVGRRRSAAVRGKKVIFGEEIDESTTASDLAAQARALAAKGDYRGAVRRLFVALIYQLDERELVRLRPQATNREYLALVRRFDRLHPVMATLTDTFERVWYGEAAVDRGAYDAFESMHREASGIVSAIDVPAASS